VAAAIMTASSVERAIMKATLFVAACILCSTGIAQAAADKKTDPVPGASRDECVFVDNIQNWRVLDSRNVVLYAPNDRRVYLLQLGTPISDLKFAFKVAFVDKDHDGQLCGRSTDKVVALGSIVKQPSTVMGLTRLDGAGMQALEEQYDVQLTRKKSEKE
jgi:hypothetical protein